MISTTTAVNVALAELLSDTLGEAFTPASKAYRDHDIPKGGIQSFPAVRIIEGDVRLSENYSHVDQDITLVLLHNDSAAHGEGISNVLDVLYEMMAVIDHAFIDGEDVEGTLGGVAVTVTVRSSRPVYRYDETRGSMTYPITISYARWAGEA